MNDTWEHASELLRLISRVRDWMHNHPGQPRRIEALFATFEHEALCSYGYRFRSGEYHRGTAFAHEAAAMGCLLALVREAWGRPGATTYLRDDGWRVSLGQLEPFQRDGFTSEAEALEAALEAAPAREAAP